MDKLKHRKANLPKGLYFPKWQNQEQTQCILETWKPPSTRASHTSLAAERSNQFTSPDLCSDPSLRQKATCSFPLPFPCPPYKNTHSFEPLTNKNKTPSGVGAQRRGRQVFLGHLQVGNPDVEGFHGCSVLPSDRQGYLQEMPA